MAKCGPTCPHWGTRQICDNEPRGRESVGRRRVCDLIAAGRDDYRALTIRRSAGLGEEPAPAPAEGRLAIRCDLLSGSTGYGRIAVMLARALAREAGVPTSIEAESAGDDAGLEPEDLARHASGPAASWVVQTAQPLRRPPAGRPWVALTMHETSALRPGAASRLAGAAAIVVPCRFSAGVLADAGLHPDRIRVAPLGVDHDVFHPGGRAPRPGPPRFGMAGQVGARHHCGQRKGLEAGILAFLRAFPGDGPDAPTLDVKVTPACALDDPGHPRVRVVRESWCPRRMADWLRTLDAYACPSAGEGHGLITAEAMACGLPVVYADNTATGEICGPWGGWPVPCRREPAGACYRGVGDWFPPDEDALIAAFRDAASDPAARREKGGRAAAATWGWTWARLAQAVLAAARDAGLPVPAGPAPDPASRPRVARVDRTAGRGAGRPAGMKLRRTPRVAISAPWHADPNGVADYAARLARALAESGLVEPALVHDPERPDDWPEGIPDLLQIPADRLDPSEFDAALHQLGNNAAHAFQIPLLAEAPGVVTLHDLRLDGIARSLRRGPDELLASICRGATSLAVHARCNLDALPGAERHKAKTIPFGADPAPLGPEARREARRREGLPEDAYLVGMGGWLTWDKLVDEAMLAFDAALGRGDLPADAHLALVGPDLGGRCAARLAELARPERVLIRPALPPTRFAAALGSMDVGLALRRPPTRGETSAALFDFLRAGVPTIVGATGTFAEQPDNCVLKVAPEAGIPGIADALARLAGDRELASRLGRAALDRVRIRHAWPVVALQYVRLLGLPCGCVSGLSGGGA